MVVIGGVMLGSGMVLEIPQDDYKFGQGLLRLMIENIGPVVEDNGEELVTIAGRSKDAQGPWRMNRRVLVRVSALRSSLVTATA